MTQVGAAAAATRVPLPDFVLMHLLAPVADFGEKEGMMDSSRLRFLHAGQRHPAGLAPRIDFERERLQVRVLPAPICEPNDERPHAMHHSTTLLEQESRPFGRTGHQRLLLLV